MIGERSRGRTLCLIAVAFIFVSIFLAWSLLRNRHLSPDSMNYICSAQNLIAGQGLNQCSIGYAGNHLRVDLPKTDPLGTHPPLYPLLIALGGKLGAPLEDAALAIPVVSYGIAAAWGAVLAARMFGPQAAAMTLGLLLLSYPLWFSASVAWAEAPSMALFLGGLALLIPDSHGRAAGPARRALLYGSIRTPMTNARGG